MKRWLGLAFIIFFCFLIWKAYQSAYPLIEMTFYQKTFDQSYHQVKGQLKDEEQIADDEQNKYLNEEEWQSLILELDDSKIVAILTTGDRSLPVRLGVDNQTLAKGVGVESLSLSGKSGNNTVFYAHRERFFWHLQQIQIGDEMVLDIRNGETLNYEVVDLQVLEMNDPNIYQIDVETSMITLVTCYPFSWFGRVTDWRYVVKGKLVH